VALVVEHDRWLRCMLARLLEDAGFAVATASNGFSGVRVARRLLPGVVVLGAALPELSSSEVAAELMAHRRVGALRIVLARDLLKASQYNPPETRLEPPQRRDSRAEVPLQRPACLGVQCRCAAFSTRGSHVRSRVGVTVAR
jgi:CheY-like chemotaxis protein